VYSENNAHLNTYTR